MKKLFNLVLNMVIVGTMFVGLGIGVMMITSDTKTTPASMELKVDYSTKAPKSNKIKGNPKKWIILDVNEDYSIARVVKENGSLYLMTIYEADDESVTIDVDGELHVFGFHK